jgi:hypothetical protein
MMFQHVLIVVFALGSVMAGVVRDWRIDLIEAHARFATRPRHQRRRVATPTARKAGGTSWSGAAPGSRPHLHWPYLRESFCRKDVLARLKNFEPRRKQSFNNIRQQRTLTASGDGSNFHQTLNASSRQSRRVSDGLSQHCIQLRLGEFLRLPHYLRADTTL